MKLSRKITISVALGVVMSIVVSVVSFAVTCNNIRQDVLRLHVIAASDNEADQQLKLKVRDGVLLAGAEVFDGSVNVENAVQKLTPELKKIEHTAENIVKENGFEYDVSVTLSREFFATRTYESVTLPAGKYLAVRVVIDEGKGKNWWCVMFPALCLPAATVKTELDDVLNEKEVQLVSRNPKFEPRFKIVEIIEKYFIS